MKTEQHLRAFTVKYLGPTCFKGARIVIHDQRFNVRRYLSYDYSVGNVLSQGWAFLESKGIDPAYYCEMHSMKGGHVILTENFTHHILGTSSEA